MTKKEQILEELAIYAQVVTKAFDDEEDGENAIFHLGRLATIARFLGFLKLEIQSDGLKNWFELEKTYQSLKMPGEPSANSRDAWKKFSPLLEMYLADKVDTENEVFKTTTRIDTPRYDFRHALKRDEFKGLIISALHASGGSSSLANVAKYIWENYEQILRRSGDIFYTWQYDMRWAASILRKEGIIDAAESSNKGCWRLIKQDTY